MVHPPARITWSSIVIAVALVATSAIPALGLAQVDPEDTWEANDRVRAIVQVGDIAYLGGRFSSLHDGGGGSVSRPGLAAIDLDDGEPTGFRAAVDGEVLALAASADGSTLFVGGLFDSIGGEDRHNLAAVDATTGDVLDWEADASSGVWALATDQKRVYVGGAFSVIGGVARARLAAVRPTTGKVITGWGPGAPNGTVRALEVAGNRVVVGGTYTAIGGVSRRFIASVRRAGGALKGWVDPPSAGVLALSTDPGDPGHVYAGTRSNEIKKYQVKRGRELWDEGGDGDVQAVQVLDGVVYGGGHFDNFDGRAEPKLVAFTDDGDHLTWNASANSTAGVFVIEGGSHLSIGGDFTRVSGEDRDRYAAFPV